MEHEYIKYLNLVRLHGWTGLFRKSKRLPTPQKVKPRQHTNAAWWLIGTCMLSWFYLHSTLVLLRSGSLLLLRNRPIKPSNLTKFKYFIKLRIDTFLFVVLKFHAPIHYLPQETFNLHMVTNRKIIIGCRLRCNNNYVWLVLHVLYVFFVNCWLLISWSSNRHGTNPVYHLVDHSDDGKWLESAVRLNSHASKIHAFLFCFCFLHLFREKIVHMLK